MNVSLDSVRALPAQQNEGFPGPDRVDPAKALDPQRLEIIRLEPGDAYTTVGKTVQAWRSVAEAKLESFQPEEMQHPSYQQFKDCALVLDVAALQLSQKESKEVYVCRDSVTGQIHGIMILEHDDDPYESFISVLATNPINIRSPKNILENQSARGAGTLLMNRAEKAAIQLNKRTIYLNSLKSAKEFYKRLGFSSKAGSDEMKKNINETRPIMEVIRIAPCDVYPTVEKIVKAWDFIARTKIRSFQPEDPYYQRFIDCIEILEMISLDITHKWLDESQIYVYRNSVTKEINHIQGIMLMQRNRPDRYDSFIQMLAIKPSFLRQSTTVLEIGTALVNRAEKEANKLDKRTLSLVPPPSAREFYKGLGFSSPLYGNEMSKKLKQIAFHPIRALPAALDHRFEVTRLTLRDVYPIVGKIVRSWDSVARTQLESFQPEQREGAAYQQCADCVDTLAVLALDIKHEWLNESEVFVCRDSVTGQELGIMTMQRNPNRYDSFINALVTNPLENHSADDVGTALVHRAEIAANRLDKHTLSLVPPPSAREFYEGLGFSSSPYGKDMSKKLRL